MKFLDDADWEDEFAYTKALVDTAVTEEGASSSDTPVVKVNEEDPSPTKNMKLSAGNKEYDSVMKYLMGDIVDVEQQAEVSLEKEFEDYMKEGSTGTINPLVWWKCHAQKFPLLAELARTYLAVPATSVPSERAFSTTGMTVTKQRAALDSETVDALVFLNKNLRSNAPLLAKDVSPTHDKCENPV